ncbi:hypothetical protein V8G54_006663 [Vigna mungo]|uniref:Uncharacterized protein n=1 Tax=Vigna mungo TaxID=3915 RepID=A0AAQ3P1Y3_VIGMU
MDELYDHAICSSLLLLSILNSYLKLWFSSFNLLHIVIKSMASLSLSTILKDCSKFLTSISVKGRQPSLTPFSSSISLNICLTDIPALANMHIRLLSSGDIGQ